jgi:hypothetical protein
MVSFDKISSMIMIFSIHIACKSILSSREIYFILCFWTDLGVYWVKRLIYWGSRVFFGKNG